MAIAIESKDLSLRALFPRWISTKNRAEGSERGPGANQKATQQDRAEVQSSTTSSADLSMAATPTPDGPAQEDTVTYPIVGGHGRNVSTSSSDYYSHKCTASGEHHF